MLKKSPKTQYLLAEKQSYEKMTSLLKDRYQNEFSWLDIQKNKPVQSDVELTVDWDSPYDYDELAEVRSIVNNVTLKASTESDLNKKEMLFNIGGKLGSTEVELGTVAITAEKILAQLPFLDELLVIHDNDFGNIMRNVDEDYAGKENFGLADMFDYNYSFSKEFDEHLKKEYGLYTIDELPEEAFTMTKEEVDVFGKKLKVEKLTMHLTEEQTKTLLKKLLEKAQKDKKLEELLREQLMMTAFASEEIEEVDEMIEEMHDGLGEAVKEIDNAKIPNGIESTIWKDSDNIVKRSFSIDFEADGDIAKLVVDGSQLLTKEQQQFAYTVVAKDDYDEIELSIDGDLSWKNQQADDTITITAPGADITYTGKEELKGKTRNFDRQLNVSDGWTDFTFFWTGDATHESDTMNANHTITADVADLDESIAINLQQQSKIIKKVNLLEETKDSVQLGKMSEDEMETFIDEELAIKVQNWIMKLAIDLQSEF